MRAWLDCIKALLEIMLLFSFSALCFCKEGDTSCYHNMPQVAACLSSCIGLSLSAITPVQFSDTLIHK